MKEEYVENLENVIKQMLRPLKNIPLNLVIECLSGHKILPFNPDEQKDKKILSILVEVAELAGSNVNKKGILRPRPNEVGNDIEPFITEALRHFGYKAEKPRTKNGKTKATGYPDIEFIDEFNRANYLECKTYNIENISTTMRSFYLSPSEDFKITKDAHHFVISFEIYVDGRVGNKNVYKCKKWKILSIEKLLVDVKYEFNSDNKRLYSKNLILAEGNVI
jgi:hypothetical protein